MNGINISDNITATAPSNHEASRPELHMPVSAALRPLQSCITSAITIICSVLVRKLLNHAIAEFSIPLPPESVDNAVGATDISMKD